MGTINGRPMDGGIKGNDGNDFGDYYDHWNR